MSLTPGYSIRRMRHLVGYPRRYFFNVPAWLEGWRHDFRDDIEAEYLHEQRQAAESARRESQ
jgi:hypothetical protein